MNSHLLVLMQLFKLYICENLLGAHCFISFLFENIGF